MDTKTMLVADENDFAALSTFRAVARRRGRALAEALTPKQVTHTTIDRVMRIALQVEPAPARARCYAMLALYIACPRISLKWASIRLRFDRPGRSIRTVSAALHCRWWNDVHLDHVLGALVEKIYEERAA